MGDEELTTEALEECGDLAAKLAAGVPEFRAMPFLDFESENDGWSFRGIAAVYDQEADLGDFTEEFRRGFARRALATGANTRLVYDHSPDHVPVLATTSASTMQIKDDVRGLEVRADMAKHYIGEAARELVKRGDIKGMSPGFVVGAGNAELRMRNGKPHRIINAVKRLFEVSLTPDPAYPGTTAEVRSLWAMRMAESLDPQQQVLMGAYQQLENRAEVQDAVTGDEARVERERAPDLRSPALTDEPANEPVEERDSGVSDAEARAEAQLAARRRRLQIMELDLAPDDRTWLVSDEAEARAEPPPRPLEEILELPRVSWSRQERERVAERRSAVHDEMFALTDGAERVGRTLTAEEREKHDSLSREFQRLGR